MLNKPIFVVKDVELVEKILNSSSDCFFNSPESCLDDALSNEIFHRSLSSLKGDEWQTARKVS